MLVGIHEEIDSDSHWHAFFHAWKAMGKWHLWPRPWKVQEFHHNDQQIVCRLWIWRWQEKRGSLISVPSATCGKSYHLWNCICAVNIFCQPWAVTGLVGWSQSFGNFKVKIMYKHCMILIKVWVIFFNTLFLQRYLLIEAYKETMDNLYQCREKMEKEKLSGGLLHGITFS